MPNSDLLDDLRSNRPRAVVPERDDPLLQKPQPVQAVPEQTCDLDHPDRLSKTPINQVQSQSELSNPSTNLDNYPDNLRRLTVRVDEEVCLKLDAVCSREGLTAETLIESLLCQCEANPNLMKKVLKGAKERYKKRKQAGVKKRTASMHQKYGD